MFRTNKEVYKAVLETAEELNLPVEVVTLAYKSFWDFAYGKVSEIPISEINSEEQLNNYRVSINIPSIGKLYTNWNKIVGVRNRYEHMMNWKRNNEKEKDSSKENNTTVY